MFEKLKKIKIEYLVVGVLLVAVIIVALNVFPVFGDSAKTESRDYVSSLETKLAEVLSEIEGAGKVSVMITADSGVRSDIDEDKKPVVDGNKSTTTSTPVLVSGKPIILREIYPDITGVVIVAEGADNFAVKMSLLDATTTALGVSCDKVQILNK